MIKKLSHCWLALMVVLLGWRSTGSTALAQVNSNWSGGNGLWSDSSNWSSVDSPNNGNGGNTFNVSVGAGQVMLDLDVVIQQFILNGGILSGTQSVTLNELMTWNAGTINGATIEASAGLNLSGNSQKGLNNGAVVNNSNVANVGGTGIISGNASTINNLSTGIFNVTADNSFTNGFGGAASNFNNQGTFSKSGGTGITQFIAGVNFNNSGTVNVHSGTLRISGGVSTGDWNANGTVLEFNSGVHTFNAGTIGGSGTVRFNGATANLNGGSYNVAGTTEVSAGTMNLGINATTGSLQFTGGTIAGSSTHAVSGLTNWSSGTLDGAGLQTGTGLELATASQKRLNSGAVVNNSGIANWSGGGIISGSGSIFNNLASGTFNATSDDLMSNGLGGAASNFNNQGTFNKFGGTGITQFIAGVNFNNSGTVNVDSGTLRISGGVSTGDWIANGAVLEFNSGVHTFNAGTIGGSGTLRFNGTTANLNGGSYNVAGTTEVSAGTMNLGINATTGSLQFTGGTIAGSSTLAVSGLTNWNSGTLDGAGLQTGTGLELATASQKRLNSGAVVNNSGIANWSGGGIISGSGSIFNNLASGIFNATSDDLMSNGLGGAASNFNNQGTFSKTSGTGITQFIAGVNFNNSGTVNVDSGTLRISGGVSTGDWIANGAVLEFNSGIHAFNAGTIGGSGTLRFSGATANLNGGIYDVAGATEVSAGTMNLGINATSGSLQFTGGTIAGSSSLAVSGLTNWSSGTLDGAGLQTGTGLELATASQKRLNSGAVVNNSGIANWSGGGIISGSGSIFNNLASGIFNATSDDLMSNGLGGAASNFNNQGIFNKFGGTGITQFTTGVNFTNSGTVSAQSGTLQFSNFLQSSGSLELSGGDVAIVGNDFVVTGGSIVGDGTLFGDLNMSGGILSPGFSAGQLQITGDLEMGNSTLWLMEIGGFAPGLEHDQMAVGGLVDLDGLLEVSLLNGFLPDVGDQFLIVDNAGVDSVVGQFIGLNEGTEFTQFGNTWQISYFGGTGNDVTLSLVSRVPEPSTFALVVICGTLQCHRRRVRKNGWIHNPPLV